MFYILYNTEKEGEIPGYISGMLLEEGHFDEMLGVPDHPRFKDKVEEEENVGKPGLWWIFRSSAIYWIDHARAMRIISGDII